MTELAEADLDVLEKCKYVGEELYQPEHDEIAAFG